MKKKVIKYFLDQKLNKVLEGWDYSVEKYFLAIFLFYVIHCTILILNTLLFV